MKAWVKHEGRGATFWLQPPCTDRCIMFVPGRSGYMLCALRRGSWKVRAAYKTLSDAQAAHDGKRIPAEQRLFFEQDTPGLVSQVKTRGLRVSLYHADQAGLSDGDSGPWVTVCEEHGGLVFHPTVTAARGYLSHPEEWCPTCQGDTTE